MYYFNLANDEFMNLKFQAKLTCKFVPRVSFLTQKLMLALRQTSQPDLNVLLANSSALSAPPTQRMSKKIFFLPCVPGIVTFTK